MTREGVRGAQLALLSEPDRKYENDTTLRFAAPSLARLYA